MHDEDIAAMKQSGTYFVPTAYLVDWMQQNGNLPLQGVRLLQHVAFVMKAGKVYKNEAQ